MKKTIIALTILIIGANCSPSIAAQVTWGIPFELITENDIDLSFGPLVYAQNGGDNIGNEDFIPAATLATLSDPKVASIGSASVSFEGIDAVYGDDASFGLIGFPFESFGDAIDHLEGQNFNVTFDIRNERTVGIPQIGFDPEPATLFDPPENDNYSIGTANDVLDSILDSQVFMDSRASLGAGFPEEDAGALEIFLNNLTVGTDYQVQIIGGADNRVSKSDPLTIDPSYMASSTGKDVSPYGTLSDGHGNTVTNVGAHLDLDSDNMGHVTTVLGTFTADNTTQQIDFLLQRGRNAGISAIILTEKQLGRPGDFNGDGKVDAADYTVWRDNLGATEDGSILAGNGNGGVVDSTDFTLWTTNFGSSSVVATSTAIPEPTSALLLGGLLIGSIRSTRRNR